VKPATTTLFAASKFSTEKMEKHPTQEQDITEQTKNITTTNKAYNTQIKNLEKQQPLIQVKHQTKNPLSKLQQIQA